MEKCFEDVQILSKVLGWLTQKKINKKGEAGSCPNFSEKDSDNTSNLRKPLNFYEMKIVNLEEEIKKKNMKEEFLKKVIREKDKKILQLSQKDCCTPSEQSK